MKLNHKLCENAKPNPAPSKAPRKLADGDGLSLYVMPNGAKYWRFSYRYDGKQKTQALGVYPEVTLKEARDLRAESRKLVANNIDPVAEKQRQKLMDFENKKNTFKAVAMDWYNNRKGMWKKRYADEVIKRLEADIFPLIGHIPIREIEPPMLLQVIRRIESRGAVDLAKRQLQKCGEIFRFAIAEGKAMRDPSQDTVTTMEDIEIRFFFIIDYWGDFIEYTCSKLLPLQL